MKEYSHRTYALLIGIDNYQSSEIYKDLRGCLQDVNLVNAYLQKSLKIPSEQIYRLTAPQAHSVLSNVRTAADPEPTYNNIVETFDKLTKIAQAGDRIYIHYSGHGGRVVTGYPELKGEKEPDEGLVPSDYALTGRYLRDVEIATLIKRMTDKGLVVTMVLDSCHSGGATRGDCAIRGGGNIDSQPMQESLIDRKELVENWRALTGERPLGTVLPASNGYVLLAACRPTEYAFEYSVQGKGRHGALTYWMIDTLNALGNQISFRTLHNRVSAKIQSRYPSQLPMLLGEEDRSLFGDRLPQSPYTATVLATDPKRRAVTISAGLAQGINVGTQFAVYPPQADLTDLTKRQAIIELVDVQATQSIGNVLSTAEGGLSADTAELEQGAPVKMLSMPAELLRRVELCGQRQSGRQANELPSELFSQQKNALAAVRSALLGNGWVVEAKGDRPSHYQVSVSREGNYEICAGLPLKNLLPIGIHQTDAPTQLVNRLVHLSKYQAVQALDNPASDISDALDCQLLNARRQSLTVTNPIVINPGERFYLQIQNVGEQPLNIAVLNLEPNWAISQVAIRGIKTPFYPLDTEQTIEIPLRFQGSSSGSGCSVKEIIKVFAACGSADFRYLLLPPLDETIEPKGALDKRTTNPFAKLLAAIGSDVDSAPKLTRAVVYDPDPNAEWVTKQFSLSISA